MDEDHQETYNELLTQFKQLKQSKVLVDKLRHEIDAVYRATLWTRFIWLLFGYRGLE